MEKLDSILYVSTAVHTPKAQEIRHLVKKARVRNAEAGITGILLHHDKSFMQYIEGYEEPLDRIYQIIKDDKLHKSISVIIHEPIEHREFPEWSMAYKCLYFSSFTDPGQSLSLHQPDELKLPDEDKSTVRYLLNSFWSTNLPNLSEDYLQQINFPYWNKRAS